MRLLADSRHRSIAMLASAALLVFISLGAMQWFTTSTVDFLNPETYGQTLVLTALDGLLFLLLLLLLLLLFRNVLKVYAGEGSSGVGARLRSRMVLGAVVITVTPAALMFLFSYLLMNRSMERWFSPDASQLRDDTTSVVRELADYVASNAWSEAASVAENDAADGDPQNLQQVLASRRLTLDGGFLLVYDKDKRMVASFQAPPNPALSRSAPPWMRLVKGRCRCAGRSLPFSYPPRAEMITRWYRSQARNTLWARRRQRGARP